MEASTLPDPASPKSLATVYLSNERFHRRFTLPATDQHDDLIVSYADVGRAPGNDPRTTPTILFIPGMFASKYLGIYPMHAIGEKLGVRVLIVDRPGMGHSTDVPLAQRLNVWLESVPQLLKHLGIMHVALVSHSAGTIYCLNTLYHLRHILHPILPAVTLLAPWVHPAHSHNTAMKIVQLVPVTVLGVWHHIPRFFVTKAAPVFASSGTVFTKMSQTVFPSSHNSSDEEASVSEQNIRKLHDDFGISRDVQIELAKLTTMSMFSEATVGANSEAMLCLKKGESGRWGICDDYAEFVNQLVDLERSRGISGNEDEAKPKLKVKAYFGETDAMIGKKGQNYFEECWKEKNGEFYNILDFVSETIDGEDHDSLTQSAEVLQRIFIDASKM